MIRVGVAVYPGFQLLTLAVVSVFEYANMSLDEPLYAHELLSEHGGPVVSSCGVAQWVVARLRRAAPLAPD